MAGTIFNKRYANVAAIAAGAWERVGITEADKKEFGPFNAFRIHNQHSEDIYVIYNTDPRNGISDNRELIPAGTILELDHEEKQSFSELYIYLPQGVAVPIGKIITFVRKFGRYGKWGGETL